MAQSPEDGPKENRDNKALISNVKPDSPHDFATRPEGAVLPENVVRARYIYTNYVGQSVGYDKDGNKQDTPVDLNLKGGAIVVEYGINDELSLQFNQKFVTSYEITANSDRTMAATAAARAANKSLLNQGVCAKFSITAATCDATLNVTTPSAGQVALLNASFEDPKSSAPGLKFDTSTAIGASISRYVDSAAQAAVDKAANSSGGRGLGDLEIGALWNPKRSTDETLDYAIGGGVRIPWNRDRAATGEKSITRDAPEIALRVNFDYRPVEMLSIAWQNQSEAGIGQGKYKIGDTSMTYTRKGIRNQGFLMVKPSVAGISESLKMFSPKVGFTYDFGNELYQKSGDADVASTGARGYELKYYAGLGASLLDVGAPVVLELEYEKSRSGKNTPIAIDRYQGQVKAYYRF
ncbi:MAG: hypothetical protein NT027_11055 [Proteobacteria bacterium]|nr:hypothetical protein [Pseudomonadota bacterium]